MTRQNIIITGASSGLGKGMAIQFAQMGRNLGLCARRFERLEELKQQLEKQCEKQKNCENPLKHNRPKTARKHIKSGKYRKA